MRERLSDRIEWISIQDILTNGWASCDSKAINIDSSKCIALHEDEWNKLLDVKRADRKYKSLLKKITECGLLVPCNYYIECGMYVHGNGHHRLAAAIDLGWERLPYIQVEDGKHLGWYWKKETFAKANLMEYVHEFPQ